VRTDAAAVIWGEYLIVFGGLTNDTYWCPDHWLLTSKQKQMTAQQLKVRVGSLISRAFDGSGSHTLASG
jgi:hypothetical protein